MARSDHLMQQQESDNTFSDSSHCDVTDHPATQRSDHCDVTDHPATQRSDHVVVNCGPAKAKCVHRTCDNTVCRINVDFANDSVLH